MQFLQTKITTIEDIKSYIDNLAKNSMIYHFDDDAEDIITFVDISRKETKPAFTADQAKLLNERTVEMLKLDYDFAFDYLVENYLND
jgi:hypothetical protein